MGNTTPKPLIGEALPSMCHSRGNVNVCVYACARVRLCVCGNSPIATDTHGRVQRRAPSHHGGAERDSRRANERSSLQTRRLYPLLHGVMITDVASC